MSREAKSLITRLLAKGISDRYRVGQALAHPWMTRNQNDLPPLTQNEENMQMEGEIKLRNVQSIVLFLAISKTGRLINPNKKKELGFN
jgi:serine/threonine protein kinase